MNALLRPFVSPADWRRLLFLLSALPLGAAALTLLAAGWSVTAALAITPLVVPVLVGLAFVVRQLARSEAYLARELLGAAVDVSSGQTGGGFWDRARRVLADRAFWRRQTYLLLRVLLGWPLAIVELAVLWTGLYAISLPVTYRWLDDSDVVSRWVDTLGEALALVPVGAAVLVAGFHLLRPLSAPWPRLAARLLGGEATASWTPAQTRAVRRRTLVIFASVLVALTAVVTLVWALTTPDGYFWPAQVVLPPALALALTAWVFLVLERPELERRTAGSRALAMHVGVSTLVWLYLVAQWSLGPRGYFWPAWVLLGLGVALAIHAAVVLGRREHGRTHRLEELETTRAGAVEEQETELRRIERDLHDGAQARLVALGMSLGMAEEKLATDPAGARALLVEARTGAREALQELRDLARGIHPPILTDRGLEAAIRALAARTPLDVDVSVDLPERPRPPVETAAYFAVAEALANAGKHAGSAAIAVRVRIVDGVLVAQVRDDGAGGADPAGKGLTGLRRRVEALDGRLRVSSPPGGPTTVTAELPCGS